MLFAKKKLNRLEKFNKNLKNGNIILRKKNELLEVKLLSMNDKLVLYVAAHFC